MTYSPGFIHGEYVNPIINNWSLTSALGGVAGISLAVITNVALKSLGFSVIAIAVTFISITLVSTAFLGTIVGGIALARMYYAAARAMYAGMH